MLPLFLTFDDLEVPNDAVVGDCWLLQTGKLAKYKLIEKSLGAKILLTVHPGHVGNQSVSVNIWSDIFVQAMVQLIGRLHIFVHTYTYTIQYTTVNRIRYDTMP